MTDPRFQRATNDQNQRKSLEYHDLALGRSRNVETEDSENLICFKHCFKHEFHTSNKQVNTIVDLVILNAHNIETLFEKVNSLCKESVKNLCSILEKQEFVGASVENLTKQVDKLSRKVVSLEERQEATLKAIEKLPHIDLPTKA